MLEEGLLERMIRIETLFSGLVDRLDQGLENLAGRLSAHLASNDEFPQSRCALVLGCG